MAPSLDLRALTLLYAADPIIADERVLELIMAAPRQVADQGEALFSLMDQFAYDRRGRRIGRESRGRGCPGVPVSVFACMVKHHPGNVVSLADRLEEIQEVWGYKVELVHPGSYLMGRATWFWLGIPLLLTLAFPLGVILLGGLLTWLIPSGDSHAFWSMTPSLLWTALAPPSLAVALTFLHGGILPQVGLGRTPIRVRAAAFLCGWRESRQKHSSWWDMVRQSAKLFRAGTSVDDLAKQDPVEHC